MADVIDFATYYDIIQDYAWARNLALEVIDYLESAVNRVVQINDLQPEVDLLQSFYDTYQTANDVFGSEYHFTQAVRSLQTHILLRDTDTNVDDWWTTNRSAAELVPSEWDDLSTAAGYAYDAGNVNGSIITY